MSGAALDGNPAGIYPDQTCVDGTVIRSPDHSRPTFFNVAHVGWLPGDFMVYPGFDIWTTHDVPNEPLEFTYLNNAIDKLDPCTLREVGMLQHTFEQEGDWSMKGKRTLGEFASVWATMEVKVDNTAGPPRCQGFPTGYVIVDILLHYKNAGGPLVRYDVVGILLHDINNLDKSNALFWQNSCVPSNYCGRSYYGTGLGLVAADSAWRTYNIDFKQVLEALADPPPPGFTLDDAILGGLHVYSSVRGANYSFSLRKVDVLGVNPR